MFLSLLNILLMEIASKIGKDRRQYFITEVSRSDVKVHFNQQLDDAPQYQKQFHKVTESVPIQTQIISLEKPEIKSVENKKNKSAGINQLKSLLKSSKQMIDKKRKNMVQSTCFKVEQKQKVNKYFRVSINDEQLQNGIDDYIQSDKENPKSSIKIFFQRFQTENFKASKNTKHVINYNSQQSRRMQPRRNCKITTQSQFEDQCTKYLQKTQKEQVGELFRLVNRQMKLVNRKQPNNYYQKIRKSALKKIDYMSYNQKYYDDEEVKHLYQVVDNCNMLIHRRNSKENQKKSYKSVQTERCRQYSNKKEAILSQRNQNLFDDEENEKISLSSKNLLEKSDEANTIRNKSSKMVKISKNQRIQMQAKLNNLVNRCHQQKRMLQEVKTGMKIFQFYCEKLDSGFESRGKRLNNFIKDQEEL